MRSIDTNEMEHVTSKQMAERFGLRTDKFSRKLKPLREHYGVGSLTMKLATDQWVINPIYVEPIINYLETGELPPLKQVEALGEDDGKLIESPAYYVPVQVLDPERADTLDALVLATTPVQPVKVVPALNGQCEGLVDKLAVVVDAVQSFEHDLQQTERNLDDRESKNQQIATVVQNVGGKLEELRQRSEAADDRKIEIASQEMELKERLGKLQGML